MQSKLPHVGTTIFTVMSHLANQHNAINLSQGFPNFSIDDQLTQILNEKAKENIHQYQPMGGSPQLLSQIGQLITSSYKRTVLQDEILVTAGATQAIFSTILALIQQGDEVVILDPSYDCYAPAIILAGGKPIHVQLDADFLPNWNKIESAFSQKTRMIITNNPHNPSGRVWKEKDIEALEGLLERNPQVLLLSDEVYEHITFEQKHISVHTREKLHNRTIITSSFGKTFHITGWKIGYLIAPVHLMEEIKKVHQFNVFSVNSVSQLVLAEYLTRTSVKELSSFYQQKRDLFQSLLKESRFKLLPCEGTYFQTVDYSEISQINDLDFCKELTIKHGVASIPISVFNQSKEDNKIIRFCFAKDDDTLISATQLLCKI